MQTHSGQAQLTYFKVKQMHLMQQMQIKEYEAKWINRRFMCVRVFYNMPA